MKRLVNILRMKWVLALAGFVIGVVLVLGIRVAAYSPPAETHYHANFAVYINGQREEFKALNYYEEEAASSCSVSSSQETENGPMSRVHMHGNVNDVVHVEDSRVTWGNFLTVLGWNVGSSYLATRDSLYQDTGPAKVTYVLNGKNVSNIANTIIGDQDRLLVNYGVQTPGQITSEYGQIKNNALAADNSKDPAGCGSNHTDGSSMSERMRHMF